MRRRGLAGLITLALTVSDKPPAEFRIFSAGVNPTRKGPVVFDDLAARSVMGAYATHGADIMLDLEHLSLDDSARNYDPDARGWAKLEVRKTSAGPELWATNVRWTPDGEARLTEKRQRYISPAMRVDTKTRRVLELVNIAICGMPATDRLTPLVAARARTANTTKGSTMMNPKLLAALGLADDASDEDVAKAMADVMKDPTKMAAMLSAAFDADDQEDAEAKKDPKEDDDEDEETEEEKRKRLSAPKPGASAKPGAAAPKDGDAAAMKATRDLAAEVLTLKAQVNRSTLVETIRANRTKFTPALETWALSAFADNPDGLVVWLKAAPVLATGKHTEKPVKGAAGGGSTKLEDVKLTSADLELCKLTMSDPKALLKHKRELAAAGNPDAMTQFIDEET